MFRRMIASLSLYLYYPRSAGIIILVSSTSAFVFMSCPNPIPSPSHYIEDASSCKNGSTLFNSHNMEGYSSYVFIGDSLGDIPDSCRVNLIYLAPFTFQPKNRTNISYIDVRDTILYGFDLSWSGACCDFLKENPCNLDEANISMYCGTFLSLSLSLSHPHRSLIKRGK